MRCTPIRYVPVGHICKMHAHEICAYAMRDEGKFFIW
jgi:hypothetical protein